MKKVMNLLYEIEGKANNIIESANNEKVELHNELEKQLEKLDNDIIDSNRLKLDALQDKINQDLEKEKELLAADEKKQLEELNQYFTKNYVDLVNKTFNDVIGA